MLAFGLGTVPLMVVTGCGAALLSWAARQRLWQVAAWSVVMTGLLTIGRGVGFLQLNAEPQAVSCPFCKEIPLKATAQIRGDSFPSVNMTISPVAKTNHNPLP